MTTEKPRILVTVDEETLERIDDYRYGNRIPTRSEAVRRIIQAGLNQIEKSEK